MSTPSLVVIEFGNNRLHLRRHWGGDPEIAGRQVLANLAAARAAKPRDHFHTGSWLVRMLMADGDEGGTSLPTYEIECLPDGLNGDWAHVYIFQCLPDPLPENVIFTDVGNKWTIGYVEHADGEQYVDLVKRARWFTEEEFESFVEAEMNQGIASGKAYDVQLRDAFLRHVPPSGG